MGLTLDENKAHYQIRAYQPGRIQINEEIYQQSIIVGPDTLITDWPPQYITELTYADLTIIREHRPTILLIGTGDKLTFPELSIYGDLINQGIGVEIMNTRAACFTYNALSAENRNVIAALIIK